MARLIIEAAEEERLYMVQVEKLDPGQLLTRVQVGDFTVLVLRVITLPDLPNQVPTHTQSQAQVPYSELMDRKAKGSCFRCGERFHPLHQCGEKQLRLVILGDDEKINEEGEVIAIEVQEMKRRLMLSVMHWD